MNSSRARFQLWIAWSSSAGRWARLARMAPISRSFVRTQPEQVLLLAQVGETFHCRPSQMLNLTGMAESLQFDLAAAAVLWRWRKEQGTGDREQGTEDVNW